MDKKVSVVMCAYNGAKFIEEQVDSILNQTYPIYELIIQDDVSTDGTFSILKKYQSDSRIKIYQNKNRLGFNVNFNSALARASGDYIALSDQDDVWREDKIELLLENISDTAMIFHDSLLFTDDIEHPKGRKNGQQVNVHETYMLMKPYVPGHECFFKKELLPKILELTSREPSVSFDSLICLVGSVYGGVKYLPEALTYWRRHETAASYVKNVSPTTGLRGIVKAITALCDKKRRMNTQRYFQLVAQLDFKESVAVELVKYMKSGKSSDIWRACFVCVRNRDLFLPKKSFIKTIFVPLYFNRDCSLFIIQ